jgi:hypothetical protein
MYTVSQAQQHRIKRTYLIFQRTLSNEKANLTILFPEIIQAIYGRHDGSSVSGEIARKFRSENFWDFTKSVEFF